MILYKHRYQVTFFALLAICVAILLNTANSLDISYNESLNYFQNFNELTLLTHFSTNVFGENNIALRLPFILFYTLSAILFYEMTKNYIARPRDQLITTAIFLILPGVISAALLINTSIIVIFFTLLYIVLYQKRQKHCYALLVLFLFLDNSFAILFIALFFYAIKQKDDILLIISVLLFGISMQLYGFDSGGKPKGYFLETMGIYASIFSPLVFFYFLYSLYRTGFKGKLDLLWFISTTTLLFSLLLSFRQQLDIEEFAPFVVIAIPLVIKSFLNSYRIRLPQFRTKHKFWGNLILISLLANSLLLVFNKPLYLYLDNPNKHFAKNYHFVSDLAKKLKEQNIYAVKTLDKQLQNRLKFYGIDESYQTYLYKNKLKDFDLQIDISYSEKILYSYYIKRY
jgi:4-amino-4-deoxy-L-arabinose transferase-like glycosyltransferase